MEGDRPFARRRLGLVAERREETGRAAPVAVGDARATVVGGHLRRPLGSVRAWPAERLGTIARHAQHPALPVQLDRLRLVEDDVRRPAAGV